MPDETPATVRLRQLVTEIAKQMQAMYTFRDIAEKLYEAGVIDSPRNPYPAYSGDKRDYVVEMISNAPNLEVFLRTTVPMVVMDSDLEGGPHTGQVEFVMKKLGYYKDEESDEAAAHGYASYTPPQTFPPEVLSMAGGSKPSSTIIQIPDLPSPVQELVEELNGCLGQGYKNASALLVRKIIHQAVFIAMAKRGKEGLLKTETGNDVELSVAIGKCSQEYGLSSQVVSRVTSAKWIGDSANHSYRVRVNEGDLERSVTGLRLFLEEILIEG